MYTNSNRLPMDSYDIADELCSMSRYASRMILSGGLCPQAELGQGGGVAS